MTNPDDLWPTRTRLTTECISSDRLDEWVATGETIVGFEDILPHAAMCESCQARIEDMRRSHAQWKLTQPKAEPFLQQVEHKQIAKPTHRHRYIAGLSSLAVAAAALFFLRPAELPVANGIRAKGAASLSVYVKRGDRVWTGGEREELHAGDKLGFAYTSTAAGYIVILGRDAAGQTNVYYPATHSAAPIPAVHSESDLPFAVELDTATGKEAILTYFCTTPVSTAELRERTRARLGPPESCVLREFAYTKKSQP